MTEQHKTLQLAVVIPTHNRRAALVDLLGQLRQHDLTGIALTVIVVVDGSTDGTLETLQTDFPWVRVIEGDGGWWWTRSVNEGCRRAVKDGARAVLLLNDDVLPGPHYFQRMRAAFEQEPGAITGSLNLTRENNGQTPRIFFSGAPTYRWWEGKIQRYHRFLAPLEGNGEENAGGKLTGLRPSVVLPGRGVMIPAEVFEKVGYYDQRHLPQYKADYDFVLRAMKKGVKTLICLDAVVYVNVAATGPGATFTRQSPAAFFASLFRKNSRTNLRHNLTYYFRHCPWWGLGLLPFTATAVMIRQLVAFLKNKKY